MISKHIHLVCAHFSVKENHIHPISYADEANLVDNRSHEQKLAKRKAVHI